MAYQLQYSGYSSGSPTDDPQYRLQYSDYPGTATGPPDPARWIGPPGPPGPQGIIGPAGPAGGGYVLPAATAAALGGVMPDGSTIANAAGAISVAYGTGANTAAAGNDARITGALQTTGGTMTGVLQTPNGTIANPSLALGAADGTGLSRAANTMVVSVQGSTVCAFFAGATASAQFYAPLIMLNNRITSVADATAATDALNQRSGDARYAAIGSGVASFNTRTGAITLSGADVTGALGYTPYNATNPSGYQTAAQITVTLAPYALSSSVPVGSNVNPLMDGTAAAGTFVGWARGDHVHPSDTSRAPLASPTFTGTPAAPTASPGTNTTQIASTAFVEAAIAGGTAGVASFNTRTGIVTLSSADVTGALTFTPYNATNPSGFQTAANVASAIAAAAAGSLNWVNNAGFSVNQRIYVSGTALAAAAFGHDRWKAGASGCTYTFTQSAGPSTTITITAGSLQQIVEGAALVGGNYMLSWTGTAQGRVGAGSYAASPVALTGITAGANTTIEFNTGTLGQVRVETGTSATPWTPIEPRQELSNCQRFYAKGSFGMSGYQLAAGGFQYRQTLPVTMRATPAIVITPITTTNVTSPTVGSTASEILPNGAATAAGSFVYTGSYTASADL
jgi:hypothetical protein